MAGRSRAGGRTPGPLGIVEPVPFPDERASDYHQRHRFYGRDADGRCRVCFPPDDVADHRRDPFPGSPNTCRACFRPFQRHPGEGGAA